MDQPVRAKFETAREMAFGDIDSVMTQIGDVFNNDFGIVWVQNFTDVYIDFSISFDGATVTFSLEPMGKLSGDLYTNGLTVSAGEAAWCQYRTGAPSSGYVQVSVVARA